MEANQFLNNQETSDREMTSSKSTGSSPAGGIWWRALGVGILLAASTLVVPRLIDRPQYEASALLMIEDAAPFIAFPSTATEGDAQRYVRTQMALMGSPLILETALSRPEVGQLEELRTAVSPVEYLHKRLDVAKIGDTDLYVARYRGDSPNAASTIANAIADEYMRYHSMEEAQRTQLVVDILEVERRRREIEVERLRRRVLDLAREAELNKLPRGDGNDVVYGKLGCPQDLVARLFDIDAAIAETNGEIAHLKHVADVESTKSDDAHASGSGLELRALTEAERKLAGLVAKREFLVTQGQQAQNAKVENSTEVELEFARHELAREEKLFEMIASRKLALQTEMREPARVRLLRKSDLPTESLQKPVSGWLLSAAAIAFVLPLAAVWTWKKF